MEPTWIQRVNLQELIDARARFVNWLDAVGPEALRRDILMMLSANKRALDSLSVDLGPFQRLAEDALAGWRLAVDAMPSPEIGNVVGLDWEGMLSGLPRELFEIGTPLVDFIRSSFAVCDAMVIRTAPDALASRVEASRKLVEALTLEHFATLPAYASYHEWELEPLWNASDLAMAVLPTLTLMHQVDAIDVISVVGQSEDDPRGLVAEYTEATSGALEHSVEVGLKRVNERLIEPFRGTTSALAPSNSDSIRHFSASSRQVLDSLLVDLAPEEDVRAWTTDPKAFGDKGPYRRTRVKYALRVLQGRHPELGKFIDRAAATLVAYMEVMSDSVHNLDSEELEQFGPILRTWFSSVCLLLLLADEFLPDDSDQGLPESGSHR